MKVFLFSYGTLQKEKVQLESFGRILEGTKDVLRGYKLFPLEIQNKSVIIKSEQIIHPIAIRSKNTEDNIDGIVFEVSEEEILKADTYEVSDYIRVKEQLVSGKMAWVYVAKDVEYPHYLTYKIGKKQPSVLKQEFPFPSLDVNEVY